MSADATFGISIMKSKSREKILNDWMHIPDEGMLKLAPYLLVRYRKDIALSLMLRARKVDIKVDPLLSSLAFGLVFDVGKPLIIQRNLESEDANLRAGSMMALAVTESDYAVKYFGETRELTGIEKEIHDIALKFCRSIHYSQVL